MRTANRTQPSRRLPACTFVAIACGLFFLFGSALADHKGTPHGGPGGDETGSPYIVVDLGPGQAEALNNSGGIVGVDGNDQAVLWELDSNGTVTPTALPMLAGGVRSQANDINDDFQVVGLVWIDDGTGSLVERAALWDVPAFGPVTAIELPGLPVAPGNHSSSIAMGISSSGLIAGTSIEWDSANRTVLDRTAVVWEIDSSGQVSTIPLPVGAEATDVNRSGAVVTGTGDLVLLDLGTNGEVIGISQITTLPGWGSAYAPNASRITDEGFIAGSAVRADGQRVAMVWTVDVDTLQIGTEELGTLPRTDRSYAFGVNASQAVGSCSTDKQGGRGSVSVETTPFLSDGGVLSDLNRLVVDLDGLKQLDWASGLNGNGEICGKGRTRFDDSRAFLAVPLP